MDIQKLLETTESILVLRGGPTSGNWGHAGRKGKRGGSGRGGGFKRIGVKDGKAGRGKIKQASRQTRAKDEREKQSSKGVPSKSVNLLRKENPKLSNVGFDAQSILGSLARGKGEAVGTVNKKELAAINKLKKAGYATYDGQTLKLTKNGKDTGKALFDITEEVDNIGRFARKLTGPKRQPGSLAEFAIDGYKELLDHEKHLLALTLPSSIKRVKDTEKAYLSPGNLKKVLGRIDASLNEQKHLNPDRIKIGDFFKVSKSEMLETKSLLDLADDILALRGGSTSGNWGHQGRPRKRGGSRRGAGFKAIGVRNPKGRGEVKAAAKKAKEKLAKDTAALIKSIEKASPGYFKKTSPGTFYKQLGNFRKTPGTGPSLGLSTGKVTLSQYQAIANHYEKQLGSNHSKPAQAKADKKKKKAGPPGKPQIGDLKNTATTMDRDDAVKSYEGFHKNATKEENAAMTRYQGTGYDGINKHLRFGTDINDADKKNIKELDKAIDKAPRLSKDTVLYRGAGFAAYSSSLGDDPTQWTGKVIEDKGYMSTTRDPSQIFPGVKAEVRAPKGTKTVYFGNLPGGPHNSEEEFLMPRGTKMVITGVELGGPSGKWVSKVHTEIIEQP